MVDRIIKFSQQALLCPAIFTAMKKDSVETWVQIGPAASFVQIHDTTTDDFPHMRVALRTQGFSYDFYQRRQNDGDHTVWQHSRGGNDETYSNYGHVEEPLTSLFECDR